MDTLEMRDGYRLHFADETVIDPKAVVVITHGFAEHYSRYDYVSESLRDKGYSVLRYDLRGHGRNERRGHLNNFEDYVEDLKEVVDYVSETSNHLPVITLGHSMGGLVTAIFGIEHPDLVKGQVLTGPALGILPSARKLNQGLMKVLSGLVGGFMINNPVDEGLCGKPGVYEAYLNDPLVLHKASLSLYFQFLFRGAGMIVERSGKYKLPCVILHGNEDPIVPVELSRNFYKAISSEKKDLKVYEGLYHEILNEENRDLVLEDITSWMDGMI